MEVDATLLELDAGPASELVVAEDGEQVRFVGEQRELDRGNASAAAGLLPVLRRVCDLARPGQALDPRKPDPLDMPDDRDPHAAKSSRSISHRAGDRRLRG